ncbi:MAG: hypothetical protein WAT39_23335 [Planctomycetota bacterium]
MKSTRSGGSFSWWLITVAAATLPGCTAEVDDMAPVDVAAWVKEHKPAVEALRAKFDAAVALVKDLPPQSVHVADPDVPLLPITDQWGEGENAVMVPGVDVRGLPEFGSDEGKSVGAGETAISVCYTGYVDLASAYAMVDRGERHLVGSIREGGGLARRLAKVRYALLAREVSFRPGTIDTDKKTFTPGSYDGVVHVVDLTGPKHLGSVAFSATNSGSFESYAGSVQFMFKNDLSRAAIRALHAELTKVMPALRMPEPPK